MKRRILTTIAAFILIAIVLLALGISVVLQSRTLVEWWQPALAAAISALSIAIPVSRLMRPLMMNLHVFFRYTASFIVSFSLISGTLYTLNYTFSDSSSRIKYSATVTRKFSEERLRSKRIGRRVYGREKNHVYFIEIELRDGKTKKIEKPLSEYLKIKKGRKVSVSEEKGLFGIDVIKTIE